MAEKVETPICVSFTSNSIGAKALIEQLEKEKFSGYKIIFSNSISEFFENFENYNVSGIIIDPVNIASLNPTQKEHRRVMEIAKEVGRNGKLQFAYGTFTGDDRMSTFEEKRRENYIFEFLEELKPLIERDNFLVGA